MSCLCLTDKDTHIQRKEKRVYLIFYFIQILLYSSGSGGSATKMVELRDNEKKADTSHKDPVCNDAVGFIMPSAHGMHEAAARRAVFACHGRGDKQPPELNRKPPLYLKFQDNSFEEAYEEWNSAENSRRTLRSLAVILGCLGMYYWATDWVNYFQNGDSRSTKRLISRGYV